MKMTIKTDKKSIMMGFVHSTIIPFILVLITQNIFIGITYYLVPLVAYETFASEKEGKIIFYVLSLIITTILFIVLLTKEISI
jgi:hypothetical protein